MYIRKNVSPKIIWFFSKKPLLVFTALSGFAYFAYVHLHWQFIAIPFLPVATIGTAVAFYVGFKNNASYDRLWEARKIWAEIEHLSRYWAMLLTQSGVIDEAGVEQNFLLSHSLVYRQLAWVNCLRFELRREFALVGIESDDLSHVKIMTKLQGGSSEELKDIVTKYTSEKEWSDVAESNNRSTALLTKQISGLNALRRSGLSDSEYEQLLGVVQSCSQQQSAAERINRFPFPRQYANFSLLFVYIFSGLLPFSLLSELAKTEPPLLFWTVPMSVLVSWIFYTMEQVGDTSENPFENGLNDVPMNSICRDIERDLKGMLREGDIPERLLPEHGILM